MFGLWYIVIILSVVAIHEMGHYSVARCLGVPVEQFSVGFGPRLLGFKAWGTAWNLRAIPLGGYVTMDADVLESKTAPRKIAIALAGPLANILPFAALGFWYIGPVLTLKFFWLIYILGIKIFATTLLTSIDFWNLLPWDHVALVGHHTAAVNHGGDFQGPIGTAHVLSQTHDKTGAVFSLGLFFTLSSISLALFNLIPLPPLDGGRILVVSIEALTSEKTATRVGGLLSALGTILVLWLMAIVIFKDIAGLF